MIITQTLKGILSAILYTLNVLVFPLYIISTSCLARILPTKRTRLWLETQVQNAPIPWTFFNTAIQRISNKGKVHAQIEGEIIADQSYLVIANHQTWIDILVLYQVFCGRMPPMKFFMKKQLLWSLPVAGLACKLMGYPFLERHSRAEIKKHPELKNKDIETTRKACQQFSRFSSSLMNFVEGTRFTQTKHERQDSPFKHLLKPKAGGISLVLAEMPQIAGVIDATIYYDTDSLGFWDYLCGRFRSIHVHARVLPITPDLIGNYYEDREFRTHIQSWLNTVFEEKDKRLEQYRAD